jgi:hypothetical protein
MKQMCVYVCIRQHACNGHTLASCWCPACCHAHGTFLHVSAGGPSSYLGSLAWRKTTWAR